MDGAISFTVCSLFFSFLLTIVYFSKKRLSTLENKLYAILIITNLVGLIIHILCGVVTPMIDGDMRSIIFSKLYLGYLLTWIMLFTIYIFVISRKSDLEKNKGENTLKEYYIKLFAYISTIYLICCAFLIILPIEIFNENGVIYTYGIAVNFLYIISGLCMIVMIICMLLNFKNIKNKKYLPIFAYMAISGVVVVIQSVQPELLLMTAMETFITFLMYFTIENPDMKLIAQLNEAKSQAEKANSAKTDFLSSMSHEIRTPLNAIVGFSQALSEEDIPDSAKEEVNDIISASESLLDIVNGILDISKIEANKLEIIDKEYSFKKVFDELVALTKARMGDKPLDFRYHYDETIPDILYGDNVRVKQVILNLLTNSVKYTKQGFVDFKVNSILKDDVCRLIISVEDSGIGIKKENIEKLFTKFERFDEKNTTIEGTGLGLAITKKLVNLMNGKIVVQSVYGKGSRFTIAIDQKVVKGKTLEDIGQKVASEFRDFDATGLRILVVDDNKLNLKVASRLLTNYKSEIITIDNGFEVIDRIKNGEKFDLILMDDMMPKMSGVETLHKLKEIENYNIPTIALTANAIEGMREKYLNEGFDDYLSKPIDKLELNKVINKYLNKN